MEFCSPCSHVAPENKGKGHQSETYHIELIMTTDIDEDDHLINDDKIDHDPILHRNRHGPIKTQFPS